MDHLPAMRALARDRRFDEARDSALAVFTAGDASANAHASLASDLLSVAWYRRHFGLGLRGDDARKHVRETGRLVELAREHTAQALEKGGDPVQAWYAEAQALCHLQRIDAAAAAWRLGWEAIANAQTRVAPAFAGHPSGPPAFTAAPPDPTGKAGLTAIVGYPKSGNVWITTLIAHCHGVEPSILASWRDLDRPHVTFSHQPIDHDQLTNPWLSRGTLLVRDPRDVLISLFHFMKTNHFAGQFKPDWPPYESIERMYEEYFLPSFLPQTDLLAVARSCSFHGWPTLRYEAMRSDPLGALTALFDAWGLEHDPTFLAEQIAIHDVEHMRDGRTRSLDVAETSHFRKGEVGQYRRELPRGIIEDIDTRFSAYLESMGYAVPA